MDYEER